MAWFLFLIAMFKYLLLLSLVLSIRPGRVYPVRDSSFDDDRVRTNDDSVFRSFQSGAKLEGILSGLRMIAQTKKNDEWML